MRRNIWFRSGLRPSFSVSSRSSLSNDSSRSARSARFFNYLHRYKQLLLKRWWVLPLTMSVGLGVQGYRVWTAPPIYVAQAQMMVGFKVTVQGGAAVTDELAQQASALRVTVADDPLEGRRRFAQGGAGRAVT